MTIAENIKRIRKAKGITQEQLAKMLGLSIMSIRRYESGAIEPKIKMVKKIADMLSVNFSEFFYGLNDEEKIRIMKETIIQADTTIEKASMDVASADSIMRYFDKLNYSGRRKLIQYAIDLSKIEEYTNWEKDKFLNNGQSFGTESAKGDTE